MYDDLSFKLYAVIPEYVKTGNFSKTSIKWLEYMSKNNTNIQHAPNDSEKELIINNKTYNKTYLLTMVSMKKAIPYMNSMGAFGMAALPVTDQIS